MSYKRVFVQSRNEWVWKFRIKVSGCFPPEIKDTIPDLGQRENDLKLHEANLINDLKKKSADNRNAVLKRKESSITFGMYIDHYKNSIKDRSHDCVLNDLHSALGNIIIKDGDFSGVESGFNEFYENQKGRFVKRRKFDPVSCEVILSDTTKVISDSCLQGYRRYFCAVCNAGMSVPLNSKLPRIKQDNNPAASITVGKPMKRCNPPEDWERQAIFDLLEDPKHSKYHWMKPFIDFARCNPIRPEDQVKLLVKDIDQLHNQICYTPGKTSGSSSSKAYPVIFPVLRDFIYSRIGDTNECPTIFFRINPDTGRKESLTYNMMDKAWRYIKKECGISDFWFYDWRHDAVNLLYSLEFTDYEIIRIAGWSSTDMLKTYDTRDRARFSKKVNEKLNSGSELIKEVV